MLNISNTHVYSEVHSFDSMFITQIYWVTRANLDKPFYTWWRPYFLLNVSESLSKCFFEEYVFFYLNIFSGWFQNWITKSNLFVLVCDVLLCFCHFPM